MCDVMTLVAVIMFIFAVTSGPTFGWGSAIFLAPLLLSFTMVVGFLYYEARIPAALAVV